MPKLYCIKDSQPTVGKGKVTEGKIYKWAPLGMSYPLDVLIIIGDDSGLTGVFLKKNFIELNELREDKILKILE